MLIFPRKSKPFQRLLCVILAATTATAPSASVVAQTNAAAMAVRQRVEGLDRGPGPEGPGTAPPQNVPTPGQAVSTEPTAGKIDTRYISPNAAIVVVLRPAQLLASPIAQALPVEIVSAAGLRYFGFDPMEMDEVIAFAEANPAAPGYGVAIKFKNPIRQAPLFRISAATHTWPSSAAKNTFRAPCR